MCLQYMYVGGCMDCGMGSRGAQAQQRATRNYSVERPSWSPPTQSRLAKCKASSLDTGTPFLIEVTGRTGKYAVCEAVLAICTAPTGGLPDPVMGGNSPPDHPASHTIHRRSLQGNQSRFYFYNAKRAD